MLLLSVGVATCAECGQQTSDCEIASTVTAWRCAHEWMDWRPLVRRASRIVLVAIQRSDGDENTGNTGQVRWVSVENTPRNRQREGCASQHLDVPRALLRERAEAKLQGGSEGQGQQRAASKAAVRFT